MKAGARLGRGRPKRIWSDTETISPNISRTAENSEELKTPPGTEQALR
jgi:hypothetical protein